MSRWVYVLYNYSQDDIVRLNEIECVYHVIGKEIGPVNGTPHLQGYIEFSTPISFLSVRRLLGNSAHVEKARADRLANTRYCCKRGDFTIYKI